MDSKQSSPLQENQENRSDSSATNKKANPTGLERQPQPPAGKSNPNIWVKPLKAAKPRILIVHDDDSISKELETYLRHAGLVSERVKTMAAGCELARSGLFQVVVASPMVSDGTWKRLAEIDSHYRPGFVVVLVARNFDFSEWGQALEDGAFEVLDALQELPKLAEVTRCALWAAYLKGAGPRPETLGTSRVA